MFRRRQFRYLTVLRLRWVFCNTVSLKRRLARGKCTKGIGFFRRLVPWVRQGVNRKDRIYRTAVRPLPGLFDARNQLSRHLWIEDRLFYYRETCVHY